MFRSPDVLIGFISVVNNRPHAVLTYLQFVMAECTRFTLVGWSGTIILNWA